MRWILIRHGKTRGNLEGRYIGCRSDENLCTEGIEELKQGTYPAAGKVYTSPMRRCLETAELLFRNGETESVTVVDMLEKIGANMYPSIFIDVTHQMEGKPLTLRAGMKLKEVTETGIICDDLANGKEETITADCVVLAMGIRSDNELIRQFEEAFDRVIPLGQTHKNPGRIATSMADGYIAARGFDPKV